MQDAQAQKLLVLVLFTMEQQKDGNAKHVNFNGKQLEKKSNMLDLA